MIRRAIQEDIDSIATLGFLEFQEEQMFRTTGLDFSLASVHAALGQIINKPDLGAVFVAVDGERIVGMIIGEYGRFITSLSQTVLHETAWYVSKPHRGRGHGFALLAALEREAWDNHARAVSVGRAETNMSDGLRAKYAERGYRSFQTMYFLPGEG